MMFHDVHDVLVARVGRFWFKLQGRVVKYGDIEFFLISSLRFRPYVDVINTKHNTKFALWSQLFPNFRNEDLRLKDIEDYIKGPTFLTCSNDDAIMLMNILFLLKVKVNVFILEENNIPRAVEATNFEIELPFYSRYLSWTLDGVESPQMQQSPPKQWSPSPQPS
ncbi:unnamed protein product [Lactuca saligna]|uniref:Uncharacterized protein n=1 Tax=Lactuca saligna TaxID=75948 RepID=A0AA35Y1H7_LACSI|nr:unnamed protein product [Lactuca saligna]